MKRTMMMMTMRAYGCILNWKADGGVSDAVLLFVERKQQQQYDAN
jgi:hypothetical protein